MIFWMTHLVRGRDSDDFLDGAPQPLFVILPVQEPPDVRRLVGHSSSYFPGPPPQKRPRHRGLCREDYHRNCSRAGGGSQRFSACERATLMHRHEARITLGPLNIRALEILLGYVGPCLMGQFTPKIRCRCLNLYRSYGIQHDDYGIAGYNHGISAHALLKKA
jgi:hypothetical protein